MGVNALQNTEIWLKRNYEKLLGNSTDPSAQSGSTATKMPTPANVMTEAYLEVLEWPYPNSFPEVCNSSSLPTKRKMCFL